MLKSVKFGLVVGIVLLGWGGAASAQAKTVVGDLLPENGVELEISATSDFYSQYIWRGMRLDNDYVYQPGVSISGYGFDLSVWGSFETDQQDGLSSDEIDTTVSYTYDLEGLSLGGQDLETLSLSVGHVYYAFPSPSTFSKEFFLGVAYDSFLAPSLTYYYDYSRESQGGGDGTYLVLDLGHSISLNEDYGITLDLGGHVGYNKRLFIRGEGGDLGLSLGVTVPMTPSLTMSPSVNYSVPFGGVEDEDDGNYEDEYFWGVGLSYSF